MHNVLDIFKINWLKFLSKLLKEEFYIIGIFELLRLLLFCFVYFISTLYIYIVSPYRTVKSKHTPYNKSLRKFINVICVDYGKLKNIYPVRY